MMRWKKVNSYLNVWPVLYLPVFSSSWESCFGPMRKWIAKNDPRNVFSLRKRKFAWAVKLMLSPLSWWCSIRKLQFISWANVVRLKRKLQIHLLNDPHVSLKVQVTPFWEQKPGPSGHLLRCFYLWQVKHTSKGSNGPKEDTLVKNKEMHVLKKEWETKQWQVKPVCIRSIITWIIMCIIKLITRHPYLFPHPSKWPWCWSNWLLFHSSRWHLIALAEHSLPLQIALSPQSNNLTFVTQVTVTQVTSYNRNSNSSAKVKEQSKERWLKFPH